jgi:copper ion binding protein
LNTNLLRRAWLVCFAAGAAVTLLTVAGYSDGNGNPQSKGVQVQTVNIPVDGMACMSCAARVKRTLKAIDGVQKVEVSLERREAAVRFQTDKVSPERLKSAIDALGYKAGKPRITEGK